ncbi:MAG TPA: ABC transporter ATP-binding protein [Candidatus Krumholzibacteria bacterium]|nr:ABC transporter ATP-binding protein [Candidatus Krumholzibacteria bacterium]
MISVKGLTRRYGATLALDGVTFDVAPGEIVGFLGPNGAGKSTTMKILTGSLAPTAGTAVVAGCDLLADPLQVRRKVGFLPEHVALYGEQGVESTLRFVAELKGVPAARQAGHVEQVMARTGLLEVRRRLVGTLSHGYRKRVGLAQALVGDPEVIILDEPTSGLDPHQIVEFRELIRSFKGTRTVLLSSHILSEVAAVCGRVLIMDKGRLVTEQLASGLAGAAEAGRAPTAQSTVVVSWDGDRQAVAEALALVAGVDDVVVTDQGAEVSIAGNPVEIRPRLVESVLASGGRLQGLQDKGPSLEDLFLRLTGGAPADPSPSADAVADGPEATP